MLNLLNLLNLLLKCGVNCGAKFSENLCCRPTSANIFRRTIYRHAKLVCQLNDTHRHRKAALGVNPYTLKTVALFAQPIHLLLRFGKAALGGFGAVTIKKGFI